MEKTIIDAIRSALPTVEVYHDFAPDNAGSPLVALQRVGGALALGGVVIGMGERDGQKEGEEERGFHGVPFWVLHTR